MQPNAATWEHTFFDSAFWKTDGGDFVPASSAAQTIDLEGPYSFGPTDGMRDDVQAWLDDPASNFGWIMIEPLPGPFATSKRFDSRHLPDTTKRPKLVITYSLGVIGDLTGDGFVNGADLANLLAQWGTDGPADFNDSGAVDGADLAFLLANWSQPIR